jgi:hypothetical protein
MYGIQGSFRAYQFDSAVATFGRALEAALDGVEGKNAKSIKDKQGRLLDTWLERPLKYRAVVGPSRPVGPTAENANDDIEQSFTIRGGG